jgi:hypothetical protein
MKGIDAESLNAIALIQQFAGKMSFMNRIKDLSRSYAVANFKDLKLRKLLQAVNQIRIGLKTRGKHHRVSWNRRSDTIPVRNGNPLIRYAFEAFSSMD